jgi:hypothetical protein
MIHGMPVAATQRLVTKAERDSERLLHLAPREQQIQIVLRTKARISYETWNVGKSFKRNELNFRGLKCAADFTVRQLCPPPALSVVLDALVETVSKPSGQMIAATKREGDRQLSTVAEVGQAAPVGIC